MTLTQLSYLVAVDTHGHFGRAADACHVTQPTLSMQIRKLERELGVVVFDRSRVPVAATDLGKRVVDQARRVLREAARISDLLDEERGEVAGELRMGVIPTLGPYLLPRFLHALAARHPRLEIRVEELPTETILDRLRREELDAGVIATPEDADDFQHTPLFDEPFVAYVNRAHPLAAEAALRPEQLPRDDMWILSEAHCFRAQVLRLCEGASGVGPRCARGVRFESGNLETLKRLVESGEGLTLLPALAVGGEAEAPGRGARVVPFAEPAPSRRVTLIRRRAYLKGHLARAFVGALLEALPPVVQPVREAASPPDPAGRRPFSYLDLGSG